MNVAARLEALAEPGGICVSRVVRDQVRDKLDFAFEEFAGSFAVETAIERRLDAYRQQGTHYLYMKRAAQRIELSDGSPRSDLVAAIKADQMLDLLSRREMSPAGREIGDARHVGKGDDAAVSEMDTLLTLSLDSGWAEPRARFSRACEERGWGLRVGIVADRRCHRVRFPVSKPAPESREMLTFAYIPRDTATMDFDEANGKLIAPHSLRLESISGPAELHLNSRL